MSVDTGHPVGAALAAAVTGRFPPVDGLAEIVPPDAAGTCAVVCFTGHAFVLTDRAVAEIEAYAPDGFGRALDAALLLVLAGPDGHLGSIDVVLVRPGSGGASGSGSGLTERPELAGHPRVRRSFDHRRHVRVLGDDRGLITIGRGLVDRVEIAVELTGAAPGRGAGRALLTDALREIDADQPVFAQVAAGNASSLRSFLACGFVPIGSEVLVERMRPIRPDRPVRLTDHET